MVGEFVINMKRRKKIKNKIVEKGIEMSLKHRKQLKLKQRIKRHKRRLKLKKKGLDPDKFFFGKYYIKKKT